MFKLTAFYYVNLEQDRANQHQKTISTPISYQYYPVDVISKQFTKLKCQYPYKIHYLGPRSLSIDLHHKKYASNASNWLAEHKEHGQEQLEELFGIIKFGKYKLNMKKVISCNISNEAIFETDKNKEIFYRAFEGMNPSLNKAEQYIFDSIFQAGNLDCVIKVQPNEFDLFLRIDSNSRGHMSWYYFSVKNHLKFQKLKFNICNLRKPSFLYQTGMKPYIFSKRQWMMNKKGWSQNGKECFYQQKPLRYNFVYEKLSIKEKYILTFSYQFIHEDDEVFFAYCIPFTYSQLQSNIIKYRNSQYVQVKMLGKSSSGLDIPIINISNPLIDIHKKRTIVMTGRIHPGQSNSSHILNGIINFLLSNQKEAAQLRSNCNFFIVPMLNPDGVILGNTRTSLSGYDLNRTFNKNSKQLYPQIYYLKGFLQKLNKKLRIFLYLDFHGHSRKKSTFSYGPNYPINHSQYERSRFFPKLIEKFNNKFRFYGSSFTLSQGKLSTARAVMLNQYKIPYFYTIQSSIGLQYDPNLLKTLAFNKQSWHQMGVAVINGLHTFILLLNYQEQQYTQRRQQKIRLKQKMQQYKFIQLSTNAEINQLKKLQSQLIQEIRKQSLVIFEKEMSSDDHNESEDIQIKKQEQLTNFYKKCNKKNNLSNSRQFIDDQLHISQSYLTQSQTISPKRIYFQNGYLQQGKKTAKNSSRRISSPKKSQQQQKIYKIFNRPSSQGQMQRNGMHTDVKHLQPIYKEKQKTILRQNYKRQSYNVATTNLNINNNEWQFQILPANIKIMRAQMKKGRALIRFYQQSKKKYGNKRMGYNYSAKEEKRSPLMPTKTLSIKSKIYQKKNDRPEDNLNNKSKQINSLPSYLSCYNIQQNKIQKSPITIKVVKLG